MTDRQVAVLRQRLMEGKTQETAAAMAVRCAFFRGVFWSTSR